MAAITAHPVVRPRRAPVTPELPIEENHQPTNVVPGPDERSLARTTAAVTTSLMLLIGTLVVAAYGAGTLVRAVVAWFMG